MWIDKCVVEYNHFIMNCLNRKSMTNVFFPVRECIGEKKDHSLVDTTGFTCFKVKLISGLPC
jgi:hypothetical protein